MAEWGRRSRSGPRPRRETLHEMAERVAVPDCDWLFTTVAGYVDAAGALVHMHLLHRRRAVVDGAPLAAGTTVNGVGEARVRELSTLTPTATPPTATPPTAVGSTPAAAPGLHRR